ncbi:oxaloacetate decarboxylase [uncultured Tateyamaria sp.]|uniref:isocitrate lyase/PEP mutase family protein n=1 Tax=uncultured Tateyamaria sp. TaxID=455651 RepID=UPI0026074717|nr:isocitrate lyase/phosphoenolpyruvate mutase family protein [uncultured Tateyamaria sp.]
MPFRALHVPGDPLIMPNPWDVGSAVLLQNMGAKALASTSAGAAFARGKPDGALSLDEMLGAATEIDAATRVPVSADLENGDADTPDGAAAAMCRAAEAGLAGASLEDLGKDGVTYPTALAIERVEAAVAATRDSRLVLTARSEGLLTGTLPRDAVCARISAFAKAGADVVFVPGLTSLEDVTAVVQAAGDTPVSVLIGARSPDLTIANLANAGVARVSVGSGMARAAYGAAMAMMRGVQATGQITYPDNTASFADIEALLK